MVNVQELAKKLTDWQGAQFVSLTYTSKKTGEKARHTLIIGAKYSNVLEKSLLELELQKPNLAAISSQENLPLPLMATAWDNVKASLEQSLKSNLEGTANPDYTKAGLYVQIAPNLQMSLADNTFEIKGLSKAKVVLEPGVYKAVKSRELTLAQNALRELLPIAKFRTFSVDAGAFEQMKMQGDILELA